MLDFIIIIGLVVLTGGFIKWCDMGLQLYFDHIKDIDAKSNGSHRDRRD